MQIRLMIQNTNAFVSISIKQEIDGESGINSFDIRFILSSFVVAATTLFMFVFVVVTAIVSRLLLLLFLLLLL